METPNIPRLKEITSRLNRARVLVVGDLILDEFIWGNVTRISPEAPVPVVWVNSENFMPGGASNVAANIRSLGAEVHLCGIVGDDDRGETLQSLLRKKGIHCEGVFADPKRPTTQKTRVIAHHQQVVRIDREKVLPISDALLERLTSFVEDRMRSVDALILEDYGKGVIVPELVRRAVRAAKRTGKIIAVDPKETHFSYYRGVSAVTPNHHEAGTAVGYKIKDEATLLKAGRDLLKKIRCETALITLGENGMAIFRAGKPMVKIPTVAQEVFDVSGAGDTVISVYTSALAVGGSVIDAAHLSNIAAGIVVGKVGVAVTTQDELAKRLRRI